MVVLGLGLLLRVAMLVALPHPLLTFTVLRSLHGVAASCRSGR